LPLSVQLQGEHQDPIGEAWWHPRINELLLGDHPDTCCLRFIDPYGDTTFNQVQIPVLVTEIQTLVDQAVDPEIRSTLRNLLAYLSSARDRPHVYVRFLGD
jgi:hypothetical protein